MAMTIGQVAAGAEVNIQTGCRRTGFESDSNCCRVYTNADGRFQRVPTVEKIVAAIQGSSGSGCC